MILRHTIVTIPWFAAVLMALAPNALAQTAKAHMALLRDITTVEGVRENPLLGYGLVVGLNGTGDRQQTIFSIQTLANILQRMGVQVATPQNMLVHNIAAVFVTATLPPFAQPGMRMDVTVSSIGDARSLEGGTLLLTTLVGADGQTYAVAQGALALGAYTAGARGNTKQVNHPTVGRVTGGALVERDTAVSLRDLSTVSLLLLNPDYATARDAAQAINLAFQQDRGNESAHVVDSRRIEISGITKDSEAVSQLLARIQELPFRYTLQRRWSSTNEPAR